MEQKEIEGCLQSSSLEVKGLQHSCGLRLKPGYVNTLVNIWVLGLHPGPLVMIAFAEREPEPVPLFPHGWEALFYFELYMPSTASGSL